MVIPLRSDGLQCRRPALKLDLTAARPLNAIGVHVDVLLDFHRELVSRYGQLAQEESAEHVQFLQIGVHKYKDL
jgi:hypothetical protein